MKTPNLKIVRALLGAVQSGDYPAFAQLCAPDVVWQQNVGFPGGSTWRGAEAIVQGVLQGNAARWSEFRVVAEEWLDADPCVVVLGHYAGRNRVSGEEFRADYAHVYTIVEGKIARFRQFTDTKILWDALS